MTWEVECLIEEYILYNVVLRSVVARRIRPQALNSEVFSPHPLPPFSLLLFIDVQATVKNTILAPLLTLHFMFMIVFSPLWGSILPIWNQRLTLRSTISISVKTPPPPPLLLLPKFKVDDVHCMPYSVIRMRFKLAMTDRLINVLPLGVVFKTSYQQVVWCYCSEC